MPLNYKTPICPIMIRPTPMLNSQKMKKNENKEEPLDHLLNVEA